MGRFCRLALRLQPDLGDARLALAYYYYYGYRDYELARTELAIAHLATPNDAEVWDALGTIDRRQGRWVEAVPNMEKATELDPRNSALLWNLGETYACLGRFEDAKHIFADGLAVHPEAYLFALAKASIELKTKGDTTPLREALQNIPADFDPGGSVTAIALQLNLIERNYEEAAQVLARCRYERLNDSGVGGFAAVFDGSALPKEWYEGFIAKGRGKPELAERAFARAQSILEMDLAQWHDDAKTLVVLAELQALRGRKEDAVELGRRAVELLPISKDAYDGPLIATKLAVVYTQVGKVDEAIQLLGDLVKVPNGPTSGSLRVEPEWDRLRGDPRFRKLIDAATVR